MANSQQQTFSLARLWRSTVVFAAAGTFIRIGANLLLVPLVSKWLSPSEQALWWIFVALGNFAFLADFGLGQAISRVYSFFWAGAEDYKPEGLGPPPKQAEPNVVRIWELHVTVQRLYGILSVGAMLVLGIVGSLMLWTPIQAATNPQQVWILWSIYLVTVAYNFWAGHWSLAAQGTNQIRAMHASYVYSSLSYLIITAWMLRSGYGLVSMVVATIVRGIVLKMLARRAFWAAMPSAAPDVKPRFELLKRLWPNAWKFSVMSLGGYLVANASVIISGQLLGSEVTASIGLTNQVTMFIGSFASLWLNVKWPQITILRTQGKLTEMSVLFARRLLFVMISYVALAFAVVCFGNALLEWRGGQTRLLPTPYFIFYIVYYGVQLFYVQFGMLTFTENVVPFFNISLLTGVGLVVVSLFTTPLFGLWGLLLAPLLAEWACSGWFTIRRGFRGQPLKIPQFIRSAIQGRL